MKSETDSDYIQDQQQLQQNPSAKDSEENNKFRIQKKQEPPSKGKWTEDEHLKYIIFMDYYSKVFQSSDKRRLMKVFTQMANAIGSRCSQQCRSHHQKMKQKYGSSKKIVSISKKQFSNYKQAFEKFTQNLKDPFIQSQIFVQNPEMKPKKESVTVETQTNNVTVINLQERAYLLSHSYQIPEMWPNMNKYHPMSGMNGKKF